MRHSLSDKDPVERTAVCSVCGPVGIYPAGAGWVCLNKKREATAAWKANNPAAAAANRLIQSEHKLMDYNLNTMAGHCPLDGYVDIVAWGRGYACAVMAADRRSQQEEQPKVRCRDCARWQGRDQFVMGRCPPCVTLNTPTETWVTWDTAKRKAAIDGQVMPHLENSDLTVSRQLSDPPLTRKDFTAPELKTIGPKVPKHEVQKWNDLLRGEGL